MGKTIDVSKKSLPEIANWAKTRKNDAQQSLREAHALFQHYLTHEKDLWAKGAIRQLLWETEKALGKHPLYHSQAGQDRFVHEHYFQTVSSGVFVEIGGFDGYHGSNSFFFEKILGWRGLVVEAASSYQQQLRAVRSCDLLHAAVSDEDGEAEFTEVTSGYLQMSSLSSELDEARQQLLLQNPAHQERTTRVPTKRLDTLLREANLTRIDFCSIDVEGSERTILEAFDFSEFEISVFAVENGDMAESGSFLDLFQPVGYDLVSILGADEIYAKPA
ncbi:MAG: FkbM family methyltransferase [Verrucomicrobiota bacterium]